MHSFQIVSIHAGWFEVKFMLNGAVIILTNSDYLGNDAPAILIKTLNHLLENKITEAWLCWHDEPGATIWHLKNSQDILFMSIAYAVKDSWSLPYEGESLSHEALMEIVAEFSVPLYTFAKEVYDEFHEYSLENNQRSYEAEWMDFPSDEFLQLKKLLKIYN